MHWEPQRGEETQNFTVCFTASADAQGGMEEIKICIQIYVPKCKYCVQVNSADTPWR